MIRRRIRFARDERGSVSAEMGLLSGLMIVLTLSVVEAGFIYFQYNSVQQAARHGARLAALSDPVSQSVATLSDGTSSFDIVCTHTGCTSGGVDSAAMTHLVYGPDNDRACGPKPTEARGICDLNAAITPANIRVRYASVGAGRAGREQDPAPLVTVTVEDVPFKPVLLGALFPQNARYLPSVSASLMGEDLSHD